MSRSAAGPAETAGPAASVVSFLGLLPQRRSRPDPPGLVVELHADDLAPRAARHVVRDALCAAGVSDDDIGSAQLVVSELVTNVVRHGGPSLRLAIVRHDSGVRIEVTDNGGGLVARKPAVEHVPGGRGLRVVQGLAHAWGVAERLDTKTVWCELVFPPASGHAEARQDGTCAPDP
jgi:anti-sigma regulatory factor (Ser/Thr protein kinase)